MDARAHFHDGSDPFVAQNPSRLHGWDIPLKNVKVGATDGGGFHPHYRITGIDELWIWNVRP
ncbi:hypothetical protein GCM10009628_11300 [Paeniglutamicibacter kerguelensis]